MLTFTYALTINENVRNIRDSDDKTDCSKYPCKN